MNINLTQAQLVKEVANKNSIKDFKDTTDPKIIGPGSWNIIHRMAFAAKTRPAMENFIFLMKQICDGFPCKVCKGHCQEYIKNHPMEKEYNTLVGGESLGMFLWSWRFHNAVNLRLGKPQMNWQTAYDLYSGKMGEIEVCSANCQNADEKLINDASSSEYNPFKTSYISSGSDNRLSSLPEPKIYDRSKKLMIITKKK